MRQRGKDDVLPLVKLCISRGIGAAPAVFISVKTANGDLIDEVVFNRPTSLEDGPSSRTKTLDEDAISAITSYIELNLAETVQIDRLAEESRMSEYHFFRRFKATFGTSPYALITAIRLVWAKQLIIQTELRVDVVADYVGIQNVSYFRRQFRKRFNQTPAYFRQLKRASMSCHIDRCSSQKNSRN